jgi:hypothetical protein
VAIKKNNLFKSEKTSYDKNTCVIISRIGPEPGISYDENK